MYINMIRYERISCMGDFCLIIICFFLDSVQNDDDDDDDDSA